MEYKHKIFCDTFLETFDFNASCVVAKVQKKRVLAYLYDADSPLSKYLREQVDLYALSNTFITTDLVKYKLGQVVLTGKHQYIVAAAKILLGYEDSEDKRSEFLDLINSMKQASTNNE